MTSNRLSPLDLAFLAAEDADANTSMAIASIAVLSGQAPNQDEFAEHIRRRLPAVPRWQQVLRTVPFDLATPYWADVPEIDLDCHLHRTALPAPGGEPELTALMGNVMSQRVDRERPLWEILVIEGLADGRWAILSKLHHCMADGIGGTQLYHAICDGGDHPPQHTTPVKVPSGGRLLLRTLGELAAAPVQQAASAGRALRRLLKFAAQAAKTFRVTVNEVLLAAISGAYRELLLARGERPTADAVRSLVPVNVRHGDSADVGNQISAMLPLLPVDVEDPLERLRAVHRRLADLKAGAETFAGATVVGLARETVFAPVAWAIRLALRLPQRGVVTVTTNVPGPRQPLTLMGREIVEVLPYVPIGVGVRTGVAIMSYRDTVAIGITADFDSAPEVDLLVKALEHGINDLIAAARRHAPG